ncbi:MAG: His-Xaa-Ser system radical SAM maturase HxsC [Xanthomonadaceae bacterium]|nr:His-Xaa-Ser system radical SAM maturase HxsC [Xanthomonadaceae bacterium]
MHALDAKASMSGWTSPTLVKVAGLSDFAEGQFPIERMVLDLRTRARQHATAALTALPWAGFLVDGPEHAPESKPWVALPTQALAIEAGDAIEVRPETNKVARRYRRGGNNNILFATERCNSFCVMCSQPPRDVQDDWRVQHLCDLIELIDRDTGALTITGGEPTLLGQGLRRVIAHCAAHLPQTHIQVLSNGRNFGNGTPAATFVAPHPSLIWAVPLYADHYALHDYIVQSSGAFAETVRGLYALEEARQRIEVRVVLVKPVAERLPELARFIYRNFPFVEHIALMGTEPTGFAKAHRDKLWVDPIDMQENLTEAVNYLSARDLSVSLYNLSLCTLPKQLWPFAKQSISDWKQHYPTACETCEVRQQCCGLFAWITPEWTSRGIHPIRGTHLCVSH